MLRKEKKTGISEKYNQEEEFENFRMRIVGLAFRNFH